LLIGMVGLLAFGATVALFYPGFMSRDSGDQLQEARTALTTDHHPVLMALIWRLVDRIVPGPPGMLVLISAIYWAGLTGILWALNGPMLARAIGLLVVGFFPPSWNCVAAIWKDPFMHGVMLAGVACLIAPIGRARGFRYFLALVLFVFAIGLRHNAAAAVWPLLVLLLIELPVLAGRPHRLRLVLAGGASLVLTLALTLGLQRALAPLAKPEHFWQETPAFDLAGISLNAGRVVIDPDTDLLTPGMGLEEIRKQFRPDYQVALYYCAVFSPSDCVFVFNRLGRPEQRAKLVRNWFRAVLTHPGAYLAHRSNMAARILRLGNLEKPRSFYYIQDGPPLHPLAQHYHPPARTLRVLAWLDLQQTWVGFAPWIYVLVSVLLLPVCLVWHLRGGPLLPLIFLLSGLSYLASVLLTAGGPDVRYTAWTLLCAMLALTTILLSSWDRAAERVSRWLRCATGRDPR
jgi:hypothetical protein